MEDTSAPAIIPETYLHCRPFTFPLSNPELFQPRTTSSLLKRAHLTQLLKWITRSSMCKKYFGTRCLPGVTHLPVICCRLMVKVYSTESCGWNYTLHLESCTDLKSYAAFRFASLLIPGMQEISGIGIHFLLNGSCTRYWPCLYQFVQVYF